MKKILLTLSLALVALVGGQQARAQFKLGKGLDAVKKGAQALTLTDEQMAAYVKESVDWMDKHNPVPGEDDPYTQRLRRLTEGLTEADGIPLNFKVYDVIDVNAFACPDGSVRVFSSLMDIMSDDELLGIIGHEIGHVAKRHSKKAFKNDLLTGALRDGLSAAGGTAQALSESVLGDMGQALMGQNTPRSRKRRPTTTAMSSSSRTARTPGGW